MVNKVKNTARTTIETFSMICEGDDVMVALSGGADSVALLKATLLLKEEEDLKENGVNFNICACHINHKLRAEASDKDEAFVRDLCAKLNVPLEVLTIDVKALHALQKHKSVEEVAREARYNAFKEAAEAFSEKKAGALTETFCGLYKEIDCSSFKIATAHTASDNAETVLLNMIRGTGLKGLCGIPPVRNNIIRPLIFCERAEIEAFCEEHKLSYVTDETNFSAEFTRNKIRLEILPLIKDINPSFVSGITRMCECLRDDEEFLFKLASDNAIYSIEFLITLKKPLLNRIIGDLLSQNNISPSFLRISQIAEIVELGRGKVNLIKDKFALISDGNLKIETIFQNYQKR